MSASSRLDLSQALAHSTAFAWLVGFFCGALTLWLLLCWVALGQRKDDDE